MALTVTHATTIVAADDSDYEIGTNEWHEAHTVTGTINSTDVDYSGATISPASVSVSSGVTTVSVTASSAVSAASVAVSSGLTAAAVTVSSGLTAVSILVGSTPVGLAGVQSVPVSATSMTANTTNGPATGTAEATTNKNMFTTLDFDATTSESAQFSMIMPISWDESTVTFQPVWSHTTTTSTVFSVVWQLSAVACSNDDTGDVAFGTAQYSADVGGTGHDIYVGPASSAITVGGTPAAGDFVFFRVARATADSSDAMALDARLHAIRLNITTAAGNDA